MMRGVAVPVAVATLALAGAALAAPGDPRKDIRSADQAYARSIPLLRSELPAESWTATATDFSQPNPPCLVQHYSLSALTLNAQTGRTYTHGSGVTRGGMLVESDADVFATAAQAKQAFGILTRGGLAHCLATSLAAGASASGVAAKVVGEGTVGVVLLGKGAPHVQSGGWTFLLRLSANGSTRTIEVTQVAFLRGRTLASLGVVRTHSARLWPPLPSLEARIASRMTRP
jgi:hypothetical protein